MLTGFRRVGGINTNTEAPGKRKHMHECAPHTLSREPTSWKVGGGEASAGEGEGLQGRSEFAASAPASLPPQLDSDDERGWAPGMSL